MTISSATANALLDAPAKGEAPATSQIVRVARDFGVSPLRQMREMLSLRFSQARLQGPDYYANGLYDPTLDMARKREFVGIASNRALNERMSPLALVRSNEFVTNKVLYTALLTQLGLPSTRAQAVVIGQNRFGALRTLGDAAALKAFLLNEARYPLFGKPNNGSLSVGSVSITEIDRDREELILATGRRVALADFCGETVGRHPTGYILQDALLQDARLSAVAGPAIGTIRMVTVIEETTPRPLYAVWKIPSPSAMSDNFWQTGSMIAALDIATGQVQRVRTGSGPDSRDIDTHPVSGAHFAGLTIPHWDALRTLACDAHMVFPEFGIFGFDIAITRDGPVIVECNDNPFHTLYQLANRQGVRHAAFDPVFERVAARARGILARRDAAKTR